MHAAHDQGQTTQPNQHPPSPTPNVTVMGPQGAAEPAGEAGSAGSPDNPLTPMDEVFRTLQVGGPEVREGLPSCCEAQFGRYRIDGLEGRAFREITLRPRKLTGAIEEAPCYHAALPDGSPLSL
jgi:hypothetical protein